MIFFSLLFKKTLQRLLKSRRPEDLEQANALIKSLVKKVLLLSLDLFRKKAFF